MKTPIIFFAILLSAGCAQQMPLVSHAHMGHALTAWHDTPDNDALLIVAEKELSIAMAEVTSLMRTSSVSDKRRLFRNAVNALNPDIESAGPGLGYGAIRAMNGTVDHLEYAAQSPDSSDNLLTSVSQLAEQGEAVSLHLTQALDLAVAGTRESDEKLELLGVALYEQLRLATAGLVAGGNQGSADDPSTVAVEEIGIRGLHVAMQAMLDRETEPRYEPLARHYVLGLVRLPNGSWGYRLPKRQATFSDYGYGSNGY